MTWPPAAVSPLEAIHYALIRSPQRTGLSFTAITPDVALASLAQGHIKAAQFRGEWFWEGPGGGQIVWLGCEVPLLEMARRQGDERPRLYRGSHD